MTEQLRLHVTSCRGLDEAADQLATWWNNAPADPFATDLLITPTAGHQRWFSQQLAQRHGVMAGVSTITLPRLIRDLEQRHLGIDPRQDPWSPAGLTGVLLDLIDENLHHEWLARLRAHLAPSAHPRPGRRLATASRLAGLLLSYPQRSPEMIQAWNQGRAVSSDGSPLSEPWQFRLWTLARERIPGLDPLSRRSALVGAVLASDHSDQRTGVVSLDPLSTFETDLLLALGQRQPTQLWSLISVDANSAVAMARLARGQQRSHDQLAYFKAAGAELSAATSRAASSRRSGLSALQQLLRGQHVEPGAPNDGSVQLHASHGLDRQIEVVREVLVGLCESDPSLEPRDIVVITTDPSDASALLDACFGLGEQGHHPGHRLRVQTNGLRPQTNPVLETVCRVLALPSSRATATDLLELCAEAAIRHRCGFSDDDLVTIKSLIARSDIRWGIDQKHRIEGFDLPIRHDTWFSGIERLLLGAAMADASPVQVDHTVAVEQVSSQELRVVGALAELISRLRKLQADLADPVPATQWLSRLDHLIDLLVELPRDQAWQISAARASLRQWASNSGSAAPLTRADLRLVVEGLIGQATTRPAFGNGNLQVVNLDDLRAIPHRVVVLLGLDEDSFPLRVTRRGDDLTAGLPSETLDARERSQSAFLDAVMAAGEQLVITYAHRDPHTNDPLDEPVVISELRQALDLISTDRWQRQLHSLQPHSVENFRSDAGQQPFSFDRQAHAGAAALSVRLDAAPTPAEDPRSWRFEEPDPADPVSLDEVISFWRHPTRAMLMAAIGTSLRRWDKPLPVSLPLELYGYEESVIGNKLLGQVAAGVSIDQAISMERSRGAIPVPPLDERPIRNLTNNVQRLAAQARFGEPVTDISFTLDVDTTPLTGVVRLHGNELHSTQYASLTGSDLLAQWISLLALRASGHSGEVSAHLNRKDGQVLLAAPSRPEANAQLQWFLNWRRVGLSRPLVAPVNQLFQHCLHDGTWQSTLDASKLNEKWKWNRDEDWKPFTPASWPATASSPSGVEELSVVAVGRWIFGRIADARIRLEQRSGGPVDASRPRRPQTGAMPDSFGGQR